MERFVLKGKAAEVFRLIALMAKGRRRSIRKAGASQSGGATPASVPVFQ